MITEANKHRADTVAEGTTILAPLRRGLFLSAKATAPRRTPWMRRRRTITLTAGATIPTSFLRVFGCETMTVTAEAEGTGKATRRAALRGFRTPSYGRNLADTGH